jgi:hypothetical protein
MRSARRDALREVRHQIDGLFPAELVEDLVARAVDD